MRYAITVLALATLVSCSIPNERSPAGRLQKESDLASLGQSDRERQIVTQLHQEHPDWSAETIQTALNAYRAGKKRAEALQIQFRHQYPNATREEIEVLVEDQMNRDAVSMFPTEPPSALTAPMTQPMNCMSNRIGGTVYTNCY